MTKEKFSDAIGEKPATKVKGSVPPGGGSWIYDPVEDELTLVEEPTKKD